MKCKYCHLTTHLIDKCPTILCKNCKEVGHPQWLCKKKKTNKKNIEKNIEKNNYSFNDEIIKKKNDIIIQKNVDYYIKLNDKLWSDI
jgi:hypothetical protein